MLKSITLLAILAVVSASVFPVAAANLNPNKLYGAPTFVLKIKAL